MKKITVPVKWCGGHRDVCLGRQGENLATQITFDCTEFAATYGDGDAQVLHQRQGDASPYPCAIEQDGSDVVWTISNADTASAGHGQLELRWYVGDALAKSTTYATHVLPALAPDLADPPDEYQDWIDKLLDDVEALVSKVLPTVTADDAGKVLMVNTNGEWAATAVVNAEEVAY